jgi:hypothetical protein
MGNVLNEVLAKKMMKIDVAKKKALYESEKRRRDDGVNEIVMFFDYK